MPSSSNYPHILSKVLRGIWVITDAKFQAIESVLASRLSGEFAQDALIDGDSPTAEPHTIAHTLVVPIYGIIGKHLSLMEMMSGSCDLDSVNSALAVAEADSNIEKVILDFRSPGGTVTGVPETARRIANLAESKHVVSFTDSECCSGALWLASQASEFYCTESAEVGSVGVYLALLDKSRMYENEGVKFNAISAGKYKLSGASFRPLSTDERKMFQAQVDTIHEQFKTAVRTNRNVPDESCEGQVFTGADAIIAGFVDSLVDDIEDLL
jgi:protease-4